MHTTFRFHPLICLQLTQTIFPGFCAHICLHWHMVLWLCAWIRFQVFSLKSLRIMVKRCIYNHQGTLDLGVYVLWHLLVNILLLSLALGYTLFTWFTAKKYHLYFVGGNSVSGAHDSESCLQPSGRVLLTLHLPWFVCQAFCLSWCMKRTNESPFPCNIFHAHKSYFCKL